jgi:hypothetical protein
MLDGRRNEFLGELEKRAGAPAAQIGHPKMLSDDRGGAMSDR